MFNDEELLVDLYELTMAQGYFKLNKHREEVVFDMFIRDIPEDGKYVVAAGISGVLNYLQNFSFDKENIEYLRTLNLFEDDFLDFLKNFEFDCDVYSVREGEIVFPEEPILKVAGKRLQAQLIETYVLNQINFQSLIATKASRISDMSNSKLVADFGLRRAHSESAGLKASRASYIGGVDSTSNVLAGKRYGIPVTGTMAHSWIMGFENELKSFKEYAKIYKNDTVLLIDTYDTIEGCKNAITTGKWMEENGWSLKGIRLDSGNLIKLSKTCRKMLDEANLKNVKILASGDLNEYKIKKIEESNAFIDGYGVGTEMVTAKRDAALGGVYKLQEDRKQPVMKLSSSEKKRTLPGNKQVYRIKMGNIYKKDIIGLANDEVSGDKLLNCYMRDGNIQNYTYTIKDARRYCQKQKRMFEDKIKGLKNQDYKVEISRNLKKVVDDLTKRIKESLQKS
ncbi:MAG: nicotinate phosphoribosyltransferase [Candidatus Mcinerneyibacterium aminivorans]|uniref:Nicotinate phosphoribosyltransferase n=1 Tax=Candidatus Mcinerneyibacterium aminivorans TaxID=2703815 RepID=A0A5D0MFC7_9BACT|nr:MAG: nicotinate phosphoribosyltransferase [Candidatus Mcinerneyibacterium aminivorans]